MSLDHGWHPTVNSVARTCQPPPLITYTDLFTRTGLKPSHEQNRAYITEYITDQTNEKRARNGAVRTRRPPRQDWGLLPGRGSCHGNPTTPETHDRLFSLFPRLSAIIASLSNPLYLSLHTLAPLSSFNHRAFTPASLSVLRCCPPRAYDFSLYPSISLLSSSPRTMFLSLSLWSREQSWPRASSDRCRRKSRRSSWPPGESLPSRMIFRVFLYVERYARARVHGRFTARFLWLCDRWWSTSDDTLRFSDDFIIYTLYCNVVIQVLKCGISVS